MGEPAITPLQRFYVLDARDTALRAKESKRGSSKKVKIVGSCPDMCPEKERYGRIGKNLVSVLEMETALDENTTSRDANHCYMVKEYSRSSADQQEPLPHELRPISVLNFTMDYLICNIMDIPLDNMTLADWYDFIWNRTRSIRKDITQQQLCDIQSVEIIEKCVRFHIHCAEALSEEDTATFDPRINNENLTKCLQTLKHMYHDLQSKGIQTPNEAEFRSYDILLSLTEGETLRVIKDIRKDLLKSPLIKSAFGAALAFKSHNYVKFFKIIEKSNYLSSCILHRYIIEARTSALQIIVRAYSTQQNASMYPTSIVVKDLKFENEAEACEFCRCHGLEADESFITIDRRQFSTCASGLPASRSYLLVGSKIGDSLGEVINNGEMPPNPLHSYEPHDSFDERSMLKIHSLGSILKDDDEKVVNTGFIRDDPMETSEDTSLSLADSSNTATVSVSENTSKSKLKIQDANIHELEKARSVLLDKLSKLKYLNTEKVKQKQSALFKSPQKAKDNKTPVSSSELSLPFTSPTENSKSPLRETHNLKPGGKSKSFSRNIFKQSDICFSSDKIPTQADSLFFKHSNLDSLRPISPICMADSGRKSLSSKPSTAVSSLPVKTVVTTSSSSFPDVSSEILKNSSFQAATPMPAMKFNFNFEGKIGENSEQLLHSQLSDFLQKYETEDDFSFSESDHSEDEEFETVRSRDKELEIQKTPQVDFEASSKSSSGGILGENEITKERPENDLDMFVELIADDLYSECLKECSLSVCEEVLNEERKKEAELENELEIIWTNLARKVFIKWKHFTERKRQRRIFQNSTFFSPWEPMLLNTPYISSGALNPIKGYNKNQSLNKFAAEKIIKCRQVVPGWESFKAEDIWPLCSFRPHPSAYFGNRVKYFFKLCIVFPDQFDSSDATMFMNWVCAKFSLQRIQNFKFHGVNTFTLHDGKALVIVQAIQLGLKMSSSYVKFLDGITAMVLFVPQSTKVSNSFFKDFAALLDSDTLQYPYPLFVYFMESLESSTNVLTFLQEKLDSRYFTDIKTECLSEINNFTENSRKILQALKWLLQIENKLFLHPWLHKCSLRNYVEDSFTYAFNIILCKISLDEYKYLKQMPQHIINFYNKVMKFRASILSSELLERIHSSWPPEEIKQHLDENFIDVHTQNKCKENMVHLLLPNFEGDPMSTSHVWNYVKCISSSNCGDTDLLFIRIQSALQYTGSSFDWSHIIHICAFHLIQAQGFKFQISPESVSVYYTQDDLETFDSDDFWLEVISDIRSNSYLNGTKRKKESVFESPLKKKKWDFINNDTLSPKNIPEIKEKNIISNPFDMPDILSSQRDSFLAPLKAAMAKQIEQSETFSNKLNESLRSKKIIAEVELDDVENYFPREDSILNSKMSSTTIDNPNPLEFSFECTLNSSAQNSPDLLGDTVNKSSGNSFYSIAEKIAELKYKIEKNNILEDHFSQLLYKQL